MSTQCFVIYSTTSSYSTAGLHPRASWFFDKDIIEAAAQELARSGEALEDVAGIEWIEDEDGNFRPARDLTPDEILALSIQKLGDDGRLFTVFPTDKVGAAAFIEAAEKYGVGDEAHAVVEKFNS